MHETKYHACEIPAQVFHVFENGITDARNRVDDSPAPVHSFAMGRPKQFDERIQLTLVEGTTGRIDALLEAGEYRLDFIRTAIEVEIAKRSQEKPVAKRGKPSLAGMLSGPTPKKR